MYFCYRLPVIGLNAPFCMKPIYSSTFDLDTGKCTSVNGIKKLQDNKIYFDIRTTI